MTTSYEYKEAWLGGSHAQEIYSYRDIFDIFIITQDLTFD